MAKKGRIFIVAVFFVLVGFPLWAEQEKQEPIDPQEVNAESAPVLLTPGELVDQAFEEFQQKKGIQFGAEGNDGKIYYAAKSVVNIPSTNSQWAKARVNAFESALLKTQKDFIIDMFGRQSVKKSQEIFDDQSDDAEVFPELDKSMSKLESIYEKLVALTGAKLDEALRKLNVDPEEFKSKPPEQRKTTFMSKMTKTMLTEAIGDSTGLMPIQTFEGNDEAGNHVMGVVAMYSSKLKQLAYDISHKRVPLLKKNTGKALKEQIPADAETLSKQFGIRVLFNEDGRPCVVSFGQWSHNETGNNVRKIERRRESATENAFDEANAAIVEFLNGNIMFNREREKGEYSEEAVVKNPDGFIRREDVDKIIDKMHSTLKMQAKADLAGITTARKWMYKSPYGQELIGVVRVWTQDAAGTTNEVRKWKPGREPGEERSKDVPVRTTPGVKSGKDFVDVNDF